MAHTSVLSSLPLLFADQQAIRNVMRGMHGRQESFDANGLATALLVFCLFFVSVWGLARLFMKPQAGPNESNPRALFRDLCRLHGLARRDEHLLLRVARHHGLTDPTLLFLDQRLLLPALCGQAGHGHASRLRELQLALFTGLAAEVAKPQG
ncbi:MAG TPA: hypothetical protein VFI31_26095 [Pirellulales bacterium]|nr:hypothetical protein [Pirellulales bacterium]